MERMYRADEIKYRIDNQIQLALLKSLGNKEQEDLLLELQSKLYEEFGIFE